MMISPQTYIEQVKDLSYKELIKKRDDLIKSIRRYERQEMAGDRSGAEWMRLPSPTTVYVMNLSYLSELCAYMHDKYTDGSI